MKKAKLLWTGLAVVALGLIGFGGWLASLPPAATAAEAPAISPQEREAMLASLRFEKAGRPVVAVIGLNDATEVTDYLTPTGILRRADVADVVLVATGPGPVQLYPALRVEADATIAAFDAAYPGGADYVIVPAMSRDDDPAVVAWLQAQARKGARIIGICAGAKVVAAAGLLDGRRATTHWYYRRELLERHPSIRYVPDRRMVSDGNVTTTTGVTASMPMMLTLVEAIAGPERARHVASDIGVARWDARHPSAAFAFDQPFATGVMFNKLRFWNHEQLGIRLQPGMDEVALGLVADAWSRTYRSRAFTYAPSAEAMVSANGVRILPDREEEDWPQERRALVTGRPQLALDHALAAIASRYDQGTSHLVRMQLEYPRAEQVQ